MLRTFSGHNHFVTLVSFSPDGAYLASGSRDRTVKIWNVSDGDDQPVKMLTGHVHLILAVSFSPTGQSLVSGAADGQVRVWDVEINVQSKAVQSRQSEPGRG